MKEGKFIDKTLEKNEAHSKKESSLSPKKSPRLSKIKEKIADALPNVRSPRNKSPGKKDALGVKKDKNAVKKKPVKKSP